MEAIKKSKWIKAPFQNEERVLCFSKSFRLTKDVKKAYIQMSCLGVYTAKINGKDLPVYSLAPGWTSYKERVQYQEYDVKNLIKGINKIEIEAGIGFRFHEMSFNNTASLGNTQIGVICALVIEFKDGKKKTIYSDSSFVVSETKYRYSQIYNGETYDASFEPTYFVNAIEVLDLDTTRLIPQEGEEVVENERLKVKELIITPKGEVVLDFGQNITGYVEFKVKGKLNEICELSHGEVLDIDGNFYNGNYRTAKAKTYYICDGKTHVFKTKYTFYGFRYVRVDRWSGMINPANFVAVVVHSDMKRKGHFECSNALVNQLYSNIIWGNKDNFLDIPTDCPQRDERLGWTGDAEIFCRCASLNFDTRKFYRKWLGDLRVDQFPNGIVPIITPRIWQSRHYSAAWSDSCTIIPYQMYLTYGDKSYLSQNIDMMRRWIDFTKNDFENYSIQKEHYADWCGMDVPFGRLLGLTPRPFAAGAYTYLSTKIYLKSCKILGIAPKKEYEDYAEYLFNFVNERFSSQESYAKYYKEDSDSFNVNNQTVYSIFITFGLCKDKKTEMEMGNKLNDLVIKNGNRLTTGFIGTPQLLHALSMTGHTETAYNLLFQDKFPSWLYGVKLGATTMWEHWDSLKEDGTMWVCSDGGQMNSFNHYAYGAVGDWMYSVAGGINYDESNPGFKHIIYKPETNLKLDYVKCSIDTDYGLIDTLWERIGNKVRYKISVPNGTTATIILPGLNKEVEPGEYEFVI